MTAFLPPISAMTRFTLRWPGCVTPAVWTRCRPTSREPVKAMMSMSLCDARCSPISRPGPGRYCTTPSGSFAARNASMSLAAMTGVCPAGFMMAQLPAARAPEVIPQRIAIGTFQGARMSATPRGS